MATSPPTTYALVDDLFFRAKIEATAAAAGVAVAFARTPRELLDAASARLVLVDLGLSSGGAADSIRALKAREPAPVVIAFGAHRDVPALTAARDAGADRVLARSALVARLPDLLRGEL